MGRAIAITRTDISARELRFIAKRTRDCRVVRRILAIALVLEGVDRATSARSSGMDRQTTTTRAASRHSVASRLTNTSAKSGHPSQIDSS